MVTALFQYWEEFDFANRSTSEIQQWEQQQKKHIYLFIVHHSYSLYYPSRVTHCVTTIDKRPLKRLLWRLKSCSPKPYSISWNKTKENNVGNLNKQTTTKNVNIRRHFSYRLLRRWSCFMVQEQFYYRLMIAHWALCNGVNWNWKQQQRSAVALLNDFQHFLSIQ